MSEGRVKTPRRQQSMMGRLCAAAFLYFSSSYRGMISRFTYSLRSAFKTKIITEITLNLKLEMSSCL